MLVSPALWSGEMMYTDVRLKDYWSSPPARLKPLSQRNYFFFFFFFFALLYIFFILFPIHSQTKKRNKIEILLCDRTASMCFDFHLSVKLQAVHACRISSRICVVAFFFFYTACMCAGVLWWLCLSWLSDFVLFFLSTQVMKKERLCISFGCVEQKGSLVQNVN